MAAWLVGCSATATALGLMTHQGQFPETEKGRAIGGDLNVGAGLSGFSGVYKAFLLSLHLQPFS